MSVKANGEFEKWNNNSENLKNELSDVCLDAGQTHSTFSDVQTHTASSLF
jgi:hypothetical protein